MIPLLNVNLTSKHSSVIAAESNQVANGDARLAFSYAHFLLIADISIGLCFSW